VLYVYAITDRRERPSVPGLRDAPLRVSGKDGLFAVCSEHDDPRVEADEAALLEHERVVEALVEAGTALPMRFGSWMPGDDALLRLLTERRSEFDLALERVRGAVEIGVRALVQAEPATAAPATDGADRPGTAYLLGRLNDEKRSAAVASQLHEPLAALSRESVPLKGSLSGSANTAYLVDRADVEPFLSAVEKLDRTVECATIVCTGPWPPYSFTPGGPVE
jgi:hypothetical protein